MEARLDDKADKTSVLELNNQNEQLKAEISTLRGQIEVLLNDLANLQKRQQDFYVDLDKRLACFRAENLNCGWSSGHHRAE